jgi:hypothetical protein
MPCSIVYNCTMHTALPPYYLHTAQLHIHICDKTMNAASLYGLDYVDCLSKGTTNESHGAYKKHDFTTQKNRRI